MFTSNISLVTFVRGVGGKLSRLVYLAPRLGFVSGSVISQFLLPHNLGIFSCKRYKHYFSQTEMFTSNVQFGYPSDKGNQTLNVGRKHLSLAEIMFTSLTTKYSKIMVQ